MLLLGYEEQMRAMMRQANPGLARRFNLANAWHFENYSSEGLFVIMREAAKRSYGWGLGFDQLKAGVEQLEREKRKPNFGNAGAVNNLLGMVALRMEARTMGLPPAQRVGLVPQVVDFIPEEERDQQDPGSIFDDLVGCQQVRSRL